MAENNFCIENKFAEDLFSKARVPISLISSFFNTNPLLKVQWNHLLSMELSELLGIQSEKANASMGYPFLYEQLFAV